MSIFPIDRNDAQDATPTLRRLVRLRWLLLGAELTAVLAVPTLLGIPLPTPALLAALLLLACFNGIAALRLRRGVRLSPRALALQIAVDLVALGVLLFLCGGASNPFVSLLLLPVAAAALILPPRWAAVAAACAIVLYSFLTVSFVPLSIADAARATSLHLAGMWLTFVVCVVLVTWLIVRMTASIRARDAELAKAREQALRDERVVALGALAAGAAHELGTPLATMAVIAGELAREPSLDAAARADLELLRSQIGVCKEIVSGLAHRAGADRLDGAHAVAADRWLDEVLARWHASRPRANCRLESAGAGPAPSIVVDATLEQAVVNLLNNAANAGDDEAEARLAWDDRILSVEVLDRGRGFSEQVLMEAGRAPLPTATGGAGIGLLLAHAAVERVGGRLALANRKSGGASARLELPLAAILAGKGAA